MPTEISIKHYTAKAGAPFPASKAQEIGERVELIQQSSENNSIETEAVVEDARDGNSPLHSCFEWNDARAADRWRKHTARQILNHLTIIDEHPDGSERQRPAFLNVSLTNREDAGSDTDEASPSRNGYLNVETICGNEFYREQALQKAMRQARHWQEQFEWLEEMSGIVREIQQVEQELSM